MHNKDKEIEDEIHTSSNFEEFENAMDKKRAHNRSKVSFGGPSIGMALAVALGGDVNPYLPKRKPPKEFTSADQERLDAAETRRLRKRAKRIKQLNRSKL